MSNTALTCTNVAFALESVATASADLFPTYRDLGTVKIDMRKVEDNVISEPIANVFGRILIATVTGIGKTSHIKRDIYKASDFIERPCASKKRLASSTDVSESAMPNAEAAGEEQTTDCTVCKVKVALARCADLHVTVSVYCGGTALIHGAKTRDDVEAALKIVQHWIPSEGIVVTRSSVGELMDLQPNAVDVVRIRNMAFSGSWSDDLVRQAMALGMEELCRRIQIVGLPGVRAAIHGGQVAASRFSQVSLWVRAPNAAVSVEPAVEISGESSRKKEDKEIHVMLNPSGKARIPAMGGTDPLETGQALQRQVSEILQAAFRVEGRAAAAQSEPSTGSAKKRKRSAAKLPAMPSFASVASQPATSLRCPAFSSLPSLRSLGLLPGPPPDCRHDLHGDK